MIHKRNGKTTKSRSSKPLMDKINLAEFDDTPPIHTVPIYYNNLHKQKITSNHKRSHAEFFYANDTNQKSFLETSVSCKDSNKSIKLVYSSSTNKISYNNGLENSETTTSSILVSNLKRAPPRLSIKKSPIHPFNNLLHNKKKLLSNKKLAQSGILKKNKCLDNHNEHYIILDYWEHKNQLEKKYELLLNELKTEEAIEINIATKNFIEYSDDASLMKTIYEIKEKYRRSCNLIKEQRILEAEELIIRFQKRII